jgi:hypothetical protein
LLRSTQTICGRSSRSSDSVFTKTPAVSPEMCLERSLPFNVYREPPVSFPVHPEVNLQGWRPWRPTRQGRLSAPLKCLLLRKPPNKC